ncbi:MAG: helix-turn-helix domain-containing protein [Pseudanabaena sp. CAN_BIN31]|nr:helix-turn-helix domain-containing protein [Pseudanabaena sp. CAN_BIN31]
MFGKAIATLRKKYKLRQSDIIGLSERQVSRIEKGEGSTKADTLRLFAKAHGMGWSLMLILMRLLMRSGIFPKNLL